MGLLVDGKWTDRWYDTSKTDGKFVRSSAQFRNEISSAGPHPPERGRYHLYVSYACPWAHRTLIMRALKRLDDAVSVSVVDWLMLEQGWTFSSDNPDHLMGLDRLYELYLAANPTFSGRVTVPVLWDKQRKTIVNNESSEIIRFFNGPLAQLGDDGVDYYPANLRGEIDALNARIYETVNNGVYKCGFATKQRPYEEAFDALFATLDALEERLEKTRFLLGDQLTEADIRLFTTLIRFDAVYHSHFKCNLRRLVDYPNLWGYTRDLYGWPGVAETVHFDHIKGHYFASHTSINPHQIVPKGPELDLLAPHGRG